MLDAGAALALRPVQRGRVARRRGVAPAEPAAHRGEELARVPEIPGVHERLAAARARERGGGGRPVVRRRRAAAGAATTATSQRPGRSAPADAPRHPAPSRRHRTCGAVPRGGARPRALSIREHGIAAPSSELPAPSVPNLAFVEDLYYALARRPRLGRRALAPLLRAAAPHAGGRPGARRLPAAPRRTAPRRRRGARPSADAAFQAKVDRLVTAYREYGHLRADLDPLAAHPARGAVLARRVRALARPTSTGAAPTRRGGRRGRSARSSRASRRPTAGRSASRSRTCTTPTCAAGSSSAWSGPATAARSRPDARRRLLEKVVEAEMLEQFLAHPVPRREALQRRGGRGAAAAVRAAPRPRRRPRRPQRRHRHGPPRPAQRARQRGRQAAPRHLRRVPRHTPS